MEILKAITNEIKDLRGSTVKVFGQPQRIEEEVSPYLVDVLDVLNNLKPFEVDGITVEYNEESDEYEEVEIEEVEEYLNHLDSMYGVKETKHDNSYNWNGNISNDIDFKIYECDNGRTYVELMVHKFGDVRCNYTDSCLLEFLSETEFLENLVDCYKSELVTVDSIDYSLEISLFNEGIEVYDTVNEIEVGTIYGCYDTVEEVTSDIKDLLINA